MNHLWTMRWLGSLTLKELAVRTWNKTLEDNVFGRAAELAYYFLLALFPMLLFLTSLVGFLTGLREAIFATLANLVPGEAMKLVSETINDVTQNRSGGFIPFGVLGAVWAGSGGVTAIMGTLNTAYNVKEERSFFRIRLISIGLTLLLALLFVSGTALIMFGDRFAVWAAGKLGLGVMIDVLWSIVHYFLGATFLFIALELMYYFGPNIQQRWRWITPGAVFAVISLIASSFLFSIYLRFAPSYSATYGSIGAVIVLMLWLYLMGTVIMIGGEINSGIARSASSPTIQQVFSKPY